MRFVQKDVRDLIAHQKNGRGASYRRHRVLQRRNRLKFDFREIFGVVRFRLLQHYLPTTDSCTAANTCLIRLLRRPG